MATRRRTARIVTKSVAGQRLNLWDRLQLWREARRRERDEALRRNARQLDRIGGDLIWGIRAMFAVAIFIFIIWLDTPWIGGFAPMVAVMVMLVLAAKWLK